MSSSSTAPSFKKKLVGFLRQISQPVNHSDGSSYVKHRPDTFIHKYLKGEVSNVQPPIYFGRSCEELPPHPIGSLRRRVHGAFTGPGGGLTTVNQKTGSLHSTDPDIDFIDSDAEPDASPNAYVIGQRPPPQPDVNLKRSETEEMAGILNWNRPHEKAFGLSTTLYERHPITRERAGNPIADAFGVVARTSSGLLALADGVNWGEKACIAARCAVHGCLDYLNTAFYSPAAIPPKSTTDVFMALLRSFHAAHNLILQENGMLTTLTAAVVVPLKDSHQYAVCVCNVGDSLAYVYSKRHGVREITQGSHDIYSMRDMRDALGALGPVDGQNPELNNLTCSMTICDPGDIVFLTSDGISDNFDPVVGKFVLPKKDAARNSVMGNPKTAPCSKAPPVNQSRNKHSTESDSSKNFKSVNNRHQIAAIQKRNTNPVLPQAISQQQNPLRPNNNKIPVSRSKSSPAVNDNVNSDMQLPFVEAHQRHELTLLRMDDLLRCGLTSAGPVKTAQALCLEMVHFATKLTVAKRRILEDTELYTPDDNELSRNDQKNRRRKVCEKLALVPGKLDHASVVAYCVGEFPFDSLDKEDCPVDRIPYIPPSEEDNGAPLASPDSSHILYSHISNFGSPSEASPQDTLCSSGNSLCTLAAVEDLESYECEGGSSVIELDHNKGSDVITDNQINKENKNPNPKDLSQLFFESLV